MNVNSIGCCVFLLISRMIIFRANVPYISSASDVEAVNVDFQGIQFLLLLHLPWRHSGSHTPPHLYCLLPLHILQEYLIPCSPPPAPHLSPMHAAKDKGSSVLQSLEPKLILYMPSPLVLPTTFSLYSDGLLFRMDDPRVRFKVFYLLNAYAAVIVFGALLLLLGVSLENPFFSTPAYPGPGIYARAVSSCTSTTLWNLKNN